MKNGGTSTLRTDSARERGRHLRQYSSSPSSQVECLNKEWLLALLAPGGKAVSGVCSLVRSAGVQPAVRTRTQHGVVLECGEGGLQLGPKTCMQEVHACPSIQ